VMRLRLQAPVVMLWLLQVAAQGILDSHLRWKNTRDLNQAV
jgi:hypothetical protein